MPYTVSEEEKATMSPNRRLLTEILEADSRGDHDTARRLRRDLIIPAEALMFFKKVRGADALRRKGWNLKAAEEAYGQDWLDRAD